MCFYAIYDPRSTIYDLRDMSGNSIAGAAFMARRVGAIIGIVVVIGLALSLMWRVYLHHRQIRDVDEEPAVVVFLQPDFQV